MSRDMLDLNWSNGQSRHMRGAMLAALPVFCKIESVRHQEEKKTGTEVNKETTEAKEGRFKLLLWILRMAGFLGASHEVERGK